MTDILPLKGILNRVSFSTVAPKKHILESDSDETISSNSESQLVGDRVAVVN
jgi:hypothetical protein